MPEVKELGDGPALVLVPGPAWTLAVRSDRAVDALPDAFPRA